MAIVFQSAKKKQRMFFWAVALSLIVFLSIVSFIVFFPEFLNKNKNDVAPAVFKPPVMINYALIDSDGVKNLQPVSNLSVVFNYVAKDSTGTQVSGQATGSGKQEVKATLEASGLSIISLQEANVGRDNPFVSY